MPDLAPSTWLWLVLTGVLSLLVFLAARVVIHRGDARCGRGDRGRQTCA